VFVKNALEPPINRQTKLRAYSVLIMTVEHVMPIKIVSVAAINHIAFWMLYSFVVCLKLATMMTAQIKLRIFVTLNV